MSGNVPAQAPQNGQPGSAAGAPAQAPKTEKKAQGVRFEPGTAEKSDSSKQEAKPHAPRKLIETTVVYRCKLLGSMVVAQAKGTQLIREVVGRLSLVNEVQKGKVAPKIVDLGINYQTVYVQDVERKVMLTQHPLHQITYCAEDRRYDNIFGYIVKRSKKDQPIVCFVYETMDAEASTIVATVGKAFQIAYQKFQDTQAAQLGFKDMKDKLISDLDKLEFSKQVVELQTKVKEMEDQAAARGRPQRDETTEKFPEVVTQWESITTALEPFNVDPNMDPGTQFLIPRPETEELDGVIGRIEEQLGELQDAFSDQWFLLERLTAREKESGLAKEVMKDIDKQVQSMKGEAEELGRVPEHYQSREYQRAKEKALMPEIGMVKGKKSQWEERTKKRD